MQQNVVAVVGAGVGAAILMALASAALAIGSGLGHEGALPAYAAAGTLTLLLSAV